MARKFFLVPESKYKMLLSEDTALFDAKQRADSVLANKKLSAGEKNLLYNQRLENVLKTRKEALDRPLKVKAEQPAEDPTLAKKSRKRSWYYRYRGQEGQQPSATLETSSVSGGEEEGESGDQLVTPKKAEAGPSTSVQSVVDELSEIVMNNRSLFKVTEKGRIIGREKKVVAGSDVNRAIAHLFESTSARTPPGFKTLRSRLRDAPETSELIKRAERHFEQSDEFRPLKWNY